ncbi:MAG: DUF4168 domain-containing protein [Saprospirales bacterium]|nr:MAG: DUF4168 domain-containing protein [Saprospirales bacterium]
MLYANASRLFLGLMIFMAFSANLFAQIETTEVEDAELKKFVEIQEMITETQQSVQPKMIEVIQNNEFELNRFIEISQAIEHNQEIDATEEEMERFEETENTINELQMVANQSISDGIQERGLTVERYQEIMMAVQQSPELQNRLQDL